LSLFAAGTDEDAALPSPLLGEHATMSSIEAMRLVAI
jgi:hypothetical protein